MSIKALAEYTRISKYSKYLPEKKRRETWEEQINRVFDMHEKHLGAKLDSIKEDFYFAKDMMLKKRILGSQRALQFGGDPILKTNSKIYNCTATYCDRPRVFQECLHLLLCGCGTGLSVQKHHIAKLPEIAKRSNEEKTFLIPDSIEGWADAVGVLTSSYFTEKSSFPEYSGVKVKFDYSQIRPAGAPISWGGKAPGPNGLKQAIDSIESIFENALENGRNKLKSIEAYDIIMFLACATISGGIRRSATIIIFSHDDTEMATAKTGDWFIKTPHRGRSNNSAILLRNKTSSEDFHKLFASVKEFGEPGFIWADNLETLYNPCVELGMAAYDENGNSGWQFCNLSEINIKKCKTKDDFFDACRAVSILGTIQASYDKFPYLGEVTERIVRQDALIGCSMTGMMDCPDISFNPEIQKEGAGVVLDTNKRIAKLININECTRGCCVKPSGTASCLLGTSSGIHPQYSKRYLRRVQANMLEAPLQYFQAHNPRAVEKSVWSTTDTDMVISFLCDVPDGAKTKNSINAVQLLEYVKLTQQNWVEHGTRKDKISNAPYVRNNVSNTISIKDHEWNDVEKFIYDNREWFGGISLLPFSGDLDYPQAPFANILNEKELIVEYGEGSLFASGLIVDGLTAFNNNLWEACATALGVGKKIENFGKPEEPVRPSKNGSTDKQHASKLIAYAKDLKAYYEEIEKFNKEESKKDWVRRFKQFSDRYVGGDQRKCSHLLKHVSLWKLWLDLRREYQDVDWTLFTEEDFRVDVSTLGAQACAGGKCEL